MEKIYIMEEEIRSHVLPKKAMWYIRCTLCIAFVIFSIVIYIIKECIKNYPRVIYLIENVINKNIKIDTNVNIGEKIDYVLNNSYIIITFIFGLMIIFLPYIISKNYSYCLKSNIFEMSYGIICHNKIIIHINNVYKIRIKKSPIEKLFELSTICLYTSSGKINIKYITSDKIDVIYNIILDCLKSKGKQNI